MALIDNILAYWKLDEASGNPVDATGGGKTLTNTNSVGFAAGLINNGADFGVANTNKQLIRTGLIGTDGTYSVSLWVKLRTEITSGVYTFITVSTESNALDIAYEYNGGTRRIRGTRGKNFLPYVYADKTVTLGTSNWHHLVLTYSGSALKLYINGVLEASPAASGNGSGVWVPGGGGITVGCTHDANNPSSSFANYASTYIDEIGLWSRDITQAEVTQLYNTGLGNQYDFQPILTSPVTSISTTTATGNAQVVTDNGFTITERGVVWATTPTPTIANGKASTAGTIGTYTTAITGLLSNTLYYVRSYFTNSAGTTYGNQVSFTTLAINQYEIQKDIEAAEGQTFIGQINVTGTTGTITVKLGTTGTSTVINAGAGPSAFSGTYSGLSGLIITRSADFDGTIDDVYYVSAPLGTTVDWSLDTLTIVTAIDSSVFFKRIEDDIFNSFAFYRYLDLLFKDLDGHVTVTIRDEREDISTDRTKEFSVGNTSSGTVSPFQKKRISFLIKNQAVIIGLSNANLDETFSIAQFVLTGHQKTKKMFSPGKIISMS
jgi:hypothetical protein